MIRRSFVLATCTAVLLLPMFQHVGTAQPSPSRMRGTPLARSMKNSSARVPDLTSALHLLPPLAADDGNKLRADATLLGYLSVAICPSGGGSDCTPVAEATSLTSDPFGPISFDRGSVKYQVEWKPVRQTRGSSFDIHILVKHRVIETGPSLILGTYHYLAETPRTLPIKFRVDNHPRIRTLVLHDQGLSASAVGARLQTEFGLDAGELAGMLAADLFTAVEVAQMLKDVPRVSAVGAASILKDLLYAGGDIAGAIAIAYRITDPISLATVLRDAGFSALEAVDALEEYDDAEGPAELISLQQIGVILRDVYGASAAVAAKVLNETERFNVGQIAMVLKDSFSLTAAATTDTLKNEGFSATDISRGLKAAYGLGPSEIYALLMAAGFAPRDIQTAVGRQLAEKFAPQLRFDGNAKSFPMDPQPFFDEYVATGQWKGDWFTVFENSNPASLTTNGLIPPTFFRVVAASSGQIRIIYWFFYGYQQACFFLPFLTDQYTGAHHGDWERVIVTLTEDTTAVAAVTFFQHTGSYTRLANGGDTDRFLPTVDYTSGFALYQGEHPIVNVGRNQHGSYHDSGGRGDSLADLPYCDYFADWRHNDDRAELWLDTSRNLKDFGDPNDAKGWMTWDQAAGQPLQLLGSGDGTTTAFRLTSPIVSEITTVTVAGVDLPAVNPQSGEKNWSLVDRSGDTSLTRTERLKGDQILFKTAPQSGATISIVYANEDFRWGWDGTCDVICPERDGDVSGEKPSGVSTHPTRKSTPEDLLNINACEGKSSTIFKDAGCFESQCEWHDNQTGWTPFFPGTCEHCPSGWTDIGLLCYKTKYWWGIPYPAFQTKDYYGLDYPFSTTNTGIVR